METGEWLTRGTVWLAISLYVASQLIRLPAARWLNTLGCAAFIAHVAAAFHFYHSWSHSAAYADTARQTSELTGWNSGSGIYINYLFAAIWVFEVLWSWTRPRHYLQRSKRITWTIRAFFLFMFLNGAIIFVQNSMKWFGAALCVTLIICWSRPWNQVTSPKSP